MLAGARYVWGSLPRPNNVTRTSSFSCSSSAHRANKGRTRHGSRSASRSVLFKSTTFPLPNSTTITSGDLVQSCVRRLGAGGKQTAVFKQGAGAKDFSAVLAGEGINRGRILLFRGDPPQPLPFRGARTVLISLWKRRRWPQQRVRSKRQRGAGRARDACRTHADAPCKPEGRTRPPTHRCCPR